VRFFALLRAVTLKAAGVVVINHVLEGLGRNALKTRLQYLDRQTRPNIGPPPPTPPPGEFYSQVHPGLPGHSPGRNVFSGFRQASHFGPSGLVSGVAATGHQAGGACPGEKGGVDGASLTERFLYASGAMSSLPGNIEQLGGLFATWRVWFARTRIGGKQRGEILWFRYSKRRWAGPSAWGRGGQRRHWSDRVSDALAKGLPREEPRSPSSEEEQDGISANHRKTALSGAARTSGLAPRWGVS